MAKKQKLPRTKRLCSAGEALTAFLAARGGEDRAHVLALYDNWNMVMGQEIAPLGVPLGHKNQVLTIGVEDSMALQELFLQSAEILERANAFMLRPYFDNIKVVLTQGRPDLARHRPPRPIPPPIRRNPPRPLSLGRLADLDPESPITRCYKAYVAMYAR